jgi:hypothetical protein
MKSNPSPAGIAGLIVSVAAIGVAIYEFTAARKAETSLAAAIHDHQVDEARLQELTRSAKAAAQDQADLQRIIEQQQRAATANAQAAPGDQSAQADKAAKAGEVARNAKAAALADGQAFLASYGQSREMLLQLGRAQIGRNYARFFQMAGIPAAQAEELINQTDLHWIETITLAPNSIHPGEPELPDDQIKNILGDQGFQQLQDFKRLQPIQGLVNDVSNLSTSEPFSPEQTTQLLNIIANANEGYRGGGKADPQSIDWDQVMVQAQGVLSKPQLTVLKAESQLPQIMGLVKQYYQNHPPAK